MTDPQALAQRATARPWKHQEWCRANPHISRAIVPCTCVPPEPVPHILTFEANLSPADVETIRDLYDHIEQAEAERDEALALLADAVTIPPHFDGHVRWIAKARAFLRRQDAQAWER